MDAYESGFGPHAREITADIQKFTNIQPVIQISEVVVENSVAERGERRS
jgi:hypothetical protein